MSSILKSLENRQTTETTGDIHSKTINRTVIIPAGRSAVIWALLAGALLGICLTVLWIKASDIASQSRVSITETVPVSEGHTSPVIQQGVDSVVLQQPLKKSPVAKRLSSDGFLPVVTEASQSGEKQKPELAPQSAQNQQQQVKEVVSRQPVRDKLDPIGTDLPFEVTEIVYEKGGSANLAVVNGLPVMEGTLVDGVLLKEIHADHLVFLVEGQKIRLSLQAHSD